MNHKHLELAQTIAARIGANEELDLVKTIESNPRKTIEPRRHASSGGKAALEALRKLGASLDGKISVHHTLGEGGMGVVHLATQTTLGRHVALKTLRPGSGDVDSTLRLLREAWVTGALEHPNVVPVYDVGVSAEGLPVIVMKRIEGENWGALMHKPAEIQRRFSASDRLEWNIKILVNVCNAIHFAHSRGILHRDLKPENVMIGAFGEVYVVDWGIAISLNEDPSGRLPPASLAVDIAGTPSYMAPEMLIGEPGMLSARTDVYLLGAIFFEIFAGRPPHEGTLQQMIAAILVSQFEFPVGFPTEAQGICQKAMHRDPAERYESADAFRLAVEEYIQHRGSRKLAWDARQSLNLLTTTIEKEPPGEDRTLAVFNRLGECRFGYRAALSAWPENEAARKGLDSALLAVVHYELDEGDPNAAATLLREVSAPPPEVVSRVEAAIRANIEESERLKRLADDLDPKIGTRTRTFIGGIFGSMWTAIPLVAWYLTAHGSRATHAHTIGISASFLVIGSIAFMWARSTLSKTLLNRRASASLAVYICGQTLLSAGSALAGFTPQTSMFFTLFAWTLTYGILAVWMETCFAYCAVASAISFIVVARYPVLAYPAMAFDNLVFTIVLLWIWFPNQDVLYIREKRGEIKARARTWLAESTTKHRDEEM